MTPKRPDMPDRHEGPRRSARAEQLPLELAHDASRSRDDLVISDPLTAAVTIIDRWPDWKSPVVILCGPRGAGKSHLASIWRQQAEAVDIDLANAGNLALERGRERHVLIEDIDRAGFDETLLFHLINEVRQQGTSMLITTRLWPAAWSISLPDLRSRLRAATVVEIGEPDDELLAQVIVKLFADRQVAIDPRVVAYLVARMERSLETAQALVAEIDRLALSRRARITTALAAEALGRLGDRPSAGGAD
jgi:chromosomal replication initiation ATPase DnaA